MFFLKHAFPVCLQTERLQALLADNEKVNLSEIEPIPLPLEPQIRIRGIVPETATLFKVQKKNSFFINHFLIFSATEGSLTTEASMIFKAPVHCYVSVWHIVHESFPSVWVRVLWCQPSWSSRLRMEPCTQLSSNMETTWDRISSSFRSSRSWTKWEYSYVTGVYGLVLVLFDYSIDIDLFGFSFLL